MIYIQYKKKLHYPISMCVISYDLLIAELQISLADHDDYLLKLGTSGLILKHFI